MAEVCIFEILVKENFSIAVLALPLADTISELVLVKKKLDQRNTT